MGKVVLMINCDCCGLSSAISGCPKCRANFTEEDVPTVNRSASLTGYVELQGKYQELIYAVASKFPGESRHETALRYILERENSVNETGQADKSI